MRGRLPNASIQNNSGLPQGPTTPPPLPQKLPIAPIFIADSVSLAVSREKDGKLRLVYVGWDDVKVVLLGTSPLAEVDSGPFMTVVLTPYGSSMATPVTPWLCQTRT